MSQSMSELLAKSFQVETTLEQFGSVRLPDQLLAVMGESLKGECVRSQYLLISKRDDCYFKGNTLCVEDKCLILQLDVLEHLRVVCGERIVCSYNGVGDYFTMQRAK